MKDSRKLFNLHEGHRKRLREKFLISGLSGFHDYEIVELLLTLGTPRKDCKQTAKGAIKRFGSLRGVLEASREELQEIKGIGPHNVFGVKLVQEVARQFLKDRIVEKPILKASHEVFDYLYHAMRDLKREVFKVIFLNGRNEIITVEDLFEGTLNASAVYPREVIKAAIQKNALSLIFAHNHPSGNPHPSDLDKSMTKDLVAAALIMQINVLDHLIIGDNHYFSFADEGLIDAYVQEYHTNANLRDYR